MLIPGIAGAYLDDQLGTGFLTPIGIALGMAFAMGMLLLLSKKLTPPARGNPIPFEDDEGKDPWNADPVGGDLSEDSARDPNSET